MVSQHYWPNTFTGTVRHKIIRPLHGGNDVRYLPLHEFVVSHQRNTKIRRSDGVNKVQPTLKVGTGRRSAQRGKERCGILIRQGQHRPLGDQILRAVAANILNGDVGLPGGVKPPRISTASRIELNRTDPLCTPLGGLHGPSG